MYSYQIETLRKECGVSSLNPYSGGKCIPMIFPNWKTSERNCLNPYSGGKCIPIKNYNDLFAKFICVSILIQVVNVFLFYIACYIV